MKTVFAPSRLEFGLRQLMLVALCVARCRHWRHAAATAEVAPAKQCLKDLQRSIPVCIRMATG